MKRLEKKVGSFRRSTGQLVNPQNMMIHLMDNEGFRRSMLKKMFPNIPDGADVPLNIVYVYYRVLSKRVKRVDGEGDLINEVDFDQKPYYILVGK